MSVSLRGILLAYETKIGSPFVISFPDPVSVLSPLMCSPISIRLVWGPSMFPRCRLAPKLRDRADT